MCLQWFFVLFVFSKLYSFKLERIQHNNISILSRTVHVLFFGFFLFHVLFLLGGGGGALAFMKRTGV